MYNFHNTNDLTKKEAKEMEVFGNKMRRLEEEYFKFSKKHGFNDEVYKAQYVKHLSDPTIANFVAEDISRRNEMREIENTINRVNKSAEEEDRTKKEFEDGLIEKIKATRPPHPLVQEFRSRF